MTDGAPATAAGEAADRRLRISRIAVSAAFFCQGFSFAALVTRIPAIQDTFGLTEAALALLLAAVPVVAGFGSVIAGHLAVRFHSAVVLRICGLMVSSALVLVGAATAAVSLPMLVAALMVLGFGLGSVDATMNMQGIGVQAATGRNVMASFHAWWSLATIMGAVAASVAAATTLSLLGFFAIAACFLVPVQLVAATRFLHTRASDEAVPDPLAGSAAVPWRPLLVFGAAVVGAFVIDSSVSNWSALDLTDELAATESVAALAYAAYAVSMLLGRTFTDRLVTRHGAGSLVRIGGVVAAAGLVGVAVAPSAGLAIAAFAVVGLGISPILPLAFVAASRHDPEHTGVAVARVTWAITSGSCSARRWSGSWPSSRRCGWASRSWCWWPWPSRCQRPRSTGDGEHPCCAQDRPAVPRCVRSARRVRSLRVPALPPRCCPRITGVAESRVQLRRHNGGVTRRDDPLVTRMRPHVRTIFGEMSALATRLGAVNLGQGFPDEDGPLAVREAAIRAIADGRGNQYPPAHGLPELRQAIAAHQHRFYGIDLEGMTQVCVATGASEAIAATVLALVEPGDEVILFDPYFDLYPAVVSLAGGHRVTVPLVGPELRPDLPALAAAVTPRTRLLLLNSPHNPAGIVFTRAELERIAALAVEHDLLVLADEAYEHLWFDGHPHIPIATLPGMWERTVTIGSAGKSFSLTGWKVGWATGPQDLIAAVRVVRQHLSYVSSGPFQWAIAEGLALPDEYYDGFRAELAGQRDRLSDGLAGLGFRVVATQGTYFVSTDVRPLGFGSGAEFCAWAPEGAGVVAIPHSALSDHADADPYVRWAFCKRAGTVAEALQRLRVALPQR